MCECMCVCLQGETKVLKLKNLRPQDFANYTCQVSVRNVCDIPDSSVTFRLTNTTSEFPFTLKRSHSLSFPHYTAAVVSFAYAFCESHAFFILLILLQEKMNCIWNFLLPLTLQ